MTKGRLLLGLPLVLWGIPLLHPALQTAHTAHDAARVCQLLILAVAAIGLLFWSPSLLAQVSLRHVAQWAALLLVAALSTFLAPHPFVAVHEVVLWGGLLGLTVLLSQGLRSADDISTFLRLIVAGTAAHSVLVLLILAVAIAGGGNVYPWEALVGFDNPRFLNHAQTVVLPLVAAVATHDARPLWRRWAVVTLVFSGMILFITLGRATMLALFLGLLTALVCFRGSAVAYARRSAGFTLLGMGLMWLVYLHWLQPAGHSIDVQELASAHFRDYLLACALKLWHSAPWVGVGPMHFSHWYNGEAAHPHNVYAQVLAEYGAIGAVLILGPALQWMGRMLGTLRAAPPAHAGIAIGLMVALVGIAVDGAFSGNFVMPVSQLWIAVLIGLCLATARIFGQDEATTAATSQTPESPWTRARVLPAFLIFALKATLAIGISVMAIEALLTCAVTSSPQFDTSGPVAGRPDVDNTNPRFWTHGWF